MKRKSLVIAVCLALPIWTVLAWGEESAGTEEPNMDEASRPQKIILIPQEGKMVCVARVPELNDQRFALGIPECIAEWDGRIVNHTMANIHWEPPNQDGSVYCRWVDENIDYDVWIAPYVDYVDVLMTIRNISGRDWVDVYSFNCINPVAAPDFKDWTLERTWMSMNGAPFRMDGTTRINQGVQDTLQFYLHEDYMHVSQHVKNFKGTSPDKTDCSYIVTMSEDGTTYMGATSPKAAYLFDNLDRCCIHSAPLFGDIASGTEKTVLVRFYLGHGSLVDFLLRYFNDFPTDIHGLRVKEGAGETVALLNDSGTLIMKGSLMENSTPADTGGSDFLVRDSEGALVAAMDSGGNLVIAGSLHAGQSSLSPPEGSFVVKNHSRETVGYVSPTGDLYLKGRVVDDG